MYKGVAVLVIKLCLTLAAPWTIAHQAPLHGISKAGIWNGLPFPSPGDLPDPGIKPMSSALTGKFFNTEPPGKPRSVNTPQEGPTVQLMCIKWMWESGPRSIFQERMTIQA